MFFDEVALMPESFVNQATGRCSVKGSKFWFNCNPDGPYHWFKQNWIDKSTGYLGKEETARRMQQAAAEGKDPGLKDILYLHFTMDDNLSLDEEIKARYRSMYVGVFFKRYIMGLWAAAEGIIYDMFDENKHVQDIPGIIIRNCLKKNRRHTKKQRKPASGKSTWKKEGRTTPNGTIDIIIDVLRKREEVRPWETHFIRCR